MLQFAIAALAINLAPCLQPRACANSAAASEEKAEGEAAKSGDAKPAESAGPVSKYMPKTCRLSEHESRLTSLATKIRSFEKEISDLIGAKNKMTGAEEIRAVTLQITFKHSDLAKVVKDYESERLHVRFQHPDRGHEEVREYPRQRLKSIDDLEQAFGLDGRLDRIKNQVNVVFPRPKDKEADGGRRGIASEPVKQDDESFERIRLSK